MSLVYSDTTNKNGIIQLEESLCGMGDGTISGDTTLLAKFTGYNNMAMDEALSAIFEVDVTHKFDDYNYTDIPAAPITMASGQADYTIPVATVGANPSTTVRVNGVYYLVNGTRMYLPLTSDMTEITTTSGTPTSYRVNGKSIIFNCPLSAAFVTARTTFYVDYQRVGDAFTSADTTQQPGFLGLYHMFVPFKASSIYLFPIDRVKAIDYTNEANRIKADLQKAYTTFLDDSPKAMSILYERSD